MRTTHSLPYKGEGLPKRDPLWTETPWDRDSWIETPWIETPLGQEPLVMWPVVHAGTETPLWTEWHMPVKILPCHNFIAGGNQHDACIPESNYYLHVYNVYLKLASSIE